MQPQKRTAAHAGMADAEVFSVSHLLHTLRRYLPVITLTMLATAVLYAIVAIALFLMAPTASVTVLPFRLQFAGAENGTYPNGTKFSTSDIITAPILEQVYKNDGLSRYLTYTEFKNRVFILESNRAIDALNREYQAKLGDPKLTSVDRDRIQREYDLKLNSIVRNEFTINFASHERLSRVPPSLVEKVLNDVLLTFADHSMQEHGGLDYRVPMLTRNIFADVQPDHTTNLQISTDMLRSKIGAAIRVVDRLLQIPGAEVLRTQKEQMSLVEIRARLEDLLRFDIQPLANELRNQPWAGDQAMARSFFNAQIDFNNAAGAEMRTRQSIYQDALATYLQQRQAKSAMGVTTPPTPSATPMLSENFVDKVVQLSTQSADLTYRQKLVTSITDFGVNAVPYESEVSYYKALLSNPSTIVTSLTAAQAHERLMNIYNEAVTTVDKATEIYRMLSNNLNPGNVMYTTTAAAYQQRERTISMMRLALYGMLLLIITLPITVAGCLIHNRVREEEEEEEAFETSLADAPELPA